MNHFQSINRFGVPTLFASLSAALIGVALSSNPTQAASAKPGVLEGETAPQNKRIEFPMVRGAKLRASGCLPNAAARVSIKPDGPVEVMDVNVEGLPPNTDFDLFVIQKPGAPFGLAWYQGDIETDDTGEGHGRFIGRFNEETFIVAQAPSVPAPQVHNNAFPDANTNPVTNPVHTFHLGLWFNSFDDAVNAGCPGDVTPFNGEHNAGIQVFNTSNFLDLRGPLFFVKP